MKTVNASLRTTLITSDNGEHTYEIIKTLENCEGECGYLISIFPTRSEGNIFSNDTTLNHLVLHMGELGLCELHIINLFSKVMTNGKMSARGLSVDRDNLVYIDGLMKKPKFQSAKFIIAWGNSMLTSSACNESKTEIFAMFKKHCPKSKLYQLTAINGNIGTEISVHPLFLGIRASNATWGLKEYVPKKSDVPIKKVKA